LPFHQAPIAFSISMKLGVGRGMESILVAAKAAA
jgi:hypothetical protein